MDAGLEKLQQDLNRKIQSMCNWAEILDRVSLETAYGLLLTDKGKNTLEVWKLLLSDLEEVRLLTGKINRHPPDTFL